MQQARAALQAQASAPAPPLEAPASPVRPTLAAAEATTTLPTATTTAPSLAATVEIPPPQRLHYVVTANARGITETGHATLSWRHDGTQYEARFEVAAPGAAARSQHSVGQLTAAGLAPRRFSERRRSEEAVHFEPEHGRIVFSANRPLAALMPGTQDRLSVLLQLGAQLAGAPARHAPGTRIEVHTASTREADVWAFTIEGEEALALPGGVQATVRLSRLPRHPYEPRLELWLAPGQAYAPVRLRLTGPGGDWVDHQWSGTDKG